MNRKRKRKNEESTTVSTSRAYRLSGGKRLPAVLLVLTGLTALGTGILVRNRRPGVQVPQPANLEQLENALRTQILDQIAAIAKRPRDADRYGRLGITYEAHGFTHLARMCYENAIVADESKVRWYHHAGIAAVREGDSNRAERAFRHVLSDVPDYAPAWEWLGNLLLDRGDTTQAQRCFAAVKRLMPQAAPGYLGLARVALVTNRYSDAAGYLKEAIRLAPTSGEAHYLLGRAYKKLGRREDAEIELARGGYAAPIRLYDRWYAEVSAARVTLTARAEAAADLIGLGRIDEAVAELERLRRNHPDDVAVLNNLAMAYDRQGRSGGAVQLLENALATGRQHPTILVNLSRLLARTQRLDEALAYADRAVHLSPLLGAAHFARGVALTRLNRYKEAVDAFREAARRDARNPDVHLNLGRLLAHLQRNDEAIYSFEQAVALAPDSADARFELAALHMKLGHREEARRGFEKVLMLDPSHDRTQRAIRSLEADRTPP